MTAYDRIFDVPHEALKESTGQALKVCTGSKAARLEASRSSLHYHGKRTGALFGTSQRDGPPMSAVRLRTHDLEQDRF